MKKLTLPRLLVIGLVAALAAGCAGKESALVKKELSGSAAAVAAPQAPPEAAAKGGAAVDAASAPQEAPGNSGLAVEPVPAAELAAAMENIYFDFDRYTLSPQAREALSRSAQLVAEQEARLQIAGHCDERGSDDYNLALSEKRAVAARDYLVALGVPRERISVIGYGKEKPAAAGHDEEAWARNRRDEFIINQK